LKIETTPLEDQQVRLKVEVDPAQLEAAKRRAARHISEHTKIPGFRPGKAPYNIVQRFAGEAAILEEAMELLVQDVYPKVIEESKIKPYGPGKLENIVSQEPPTFEFLVPLDAEVGLGDYKAIRLPYKLKAIKDKDVDKVLEDLRQQQAVIEPVERPAWEGDQVGIQLSAERKNVKEGENPTLIRERSVTIVIKPEDAPDDDETGQEWPFPGFSRHLLGLSAGDEKVVTYTFPEDSSFELFRGQDAEYKIKVENVKSRTLPELNDEVAKAQGEFETLDALKAGVRQRLELNTRQEKDREYDEKIFAKLLKSSQIKYPPQMLEQEIDTAMRQLESRLGQQNMDMETYLKTRKMDREALRKELSPMAEDRMKRFLLIYEIARSEDIQVSPEEVQQETVRAMGTITSGMTPKQARRFSTRDMVNNLASNITVDKLVGNTMDRLRRIARGEFATEPAAAEEGTAPKKKAAAKKKTAAKKSTSKKTASKKAPEAKADLQSQAISESQADSESQAALEDQPVTESTAQEITPEVALDDQPATEEQPAPKPKKTRKKQVDHS